MIGNSTLKVFCMGIKKRRPTWPRMSPCENPRRKKVKPKTIVMKIDCAIPAMKFERERTCWIHRAVERNPPERHKNDPVEFREDLKRGLVDGAELR
jgi:hypothetical protein